MHVSFLDVGKLIATVIELAWSHILTMESTAERCWPCPSVFNFVRQESSKRQKNPFAGSDMDNGICWSMFYYPLSCKLVLYNILIER